MADEVIRLAAVMEAQLRGFTKGMEQAQAIADKRFGAIERRMKKSEESLSAGFKNLSEFAGAFGVALGGIELINFGKQLFESAAALQDQAKAASVSTSELQALRNVMQDSGSSTDVADRALARLTDRLGEAANGNAEAQKSLKAFGITAKESAGGAAAVLSLVAKRTLELGDATAQTAALNNLFGDKVGKYLLPALNDLALGTAALTERYKEQGRILSEDLVKAAKEAGDKMTEAGQRMKVALTPAATTIAEMIAGLAILATQWKHTAAEREAFMARDTTNPYVGSAGAQLHAKAMAAGIPLAAPKTKPPEWATPQGDIDKANAEAKKSADALSAGIMRAFQNSKDFIDERAKKEKDYQILIYDTSSIHRHDFQEQLDGITKVAERKAQDYATDESEIKRLAELNQYGGKFGGHEAYQKSLKEQVEITDQIREAFSLVGAAGVQSFDNIGDAAKQLLQQLASMAFQLLVIKPLMNSLFGQAGTSGGGLLGGLISSITSAAIPAMAGGGYAPANRPIKVGEKGTELFVPRVSGNIIPHNALGDSGSKTLNWTLVVKGTTDKELMGQMRVGMAQMLGEYDRALPTKVKGIASDEWRK